MSLDKLTVLIADDSPHEASALKDGFERCEKLNFAVTVVSTIEGLLELDRRPGVDFDVCIVDLRLSNRESAAVDAIPVGLNLILGLGSIRRGSLTIVYSASHGTPNVVRSIKLGAFDFVSKDMAPHRFVCYVETLILERRRAKLREDVLRRFVYDNGSQFSAQFGENRYLAIDINDSGEAHVIAAKPTRLEAIVAYYDTVGREGRPTAELAPYVHVVT